MKTIFALIKKDLLRDFKSPLGLIISISMPLLITTLVASIFGGNNVEQNIVLKVALLDQDDDFIGNTLRSMSSQGDASENLQLTIVDTIPDGIQKLEDRELSAFIVLPENLTANLLDGSTASIVIYENPAEAIMPQIVYQGCELLTQVVSVALDMARPEIETIVEFFKKEEFPSSGAAAMLTFNTMQKANTLRPYFFPPLAQVKTYDPKEYVDMKFDKSTNQDQTP